MIRLLLIICIIQQSVSQYEYLRSPAQVDTNPKFSESYIPGAMQIIAHVTELMKYVIIPQEGSTTTTTTTVRPTPPHKPGLYAPEVPLTHEEEIPSPTLRKSPLEQEESLNTIDTYLGKQFGIIFQLANKIDPEPNVLQSEDSQVLAFSKDFEDAESPYKYELLRQKKVPPTQAYVGLLSLYDTLNKESKKLMLNKYAGYSETVLKTLIDFSKSTSSYQLKSVLMKVIEQRQVRQSETVTKMKKIINDLNDGNSYLNKALKDIPPLVFSA